MKPYFAFQWHITDVCDQRCKHCYIFAEDNCKKLSAKLYLFGRTVCNSAGTLSALRRVLRSMSRRGGNKQKIK